MNGTLIFLIAMVALVLLALAMAARPKGGAAPRFKARALMTANEAAFLLRLEAAAPTLRFHAQVAMGALLEPALARTGKGGDYQRARNMCSQKIVDYVAQRRDTGEIVAIIELDDRSHRAERDAHRDAMLQQAGYRTVRWPSKNKPSVQEIAAVLLGGQANTAAGGPASASIAARIASSTAAGATAAPGPASGAPPATPLRALSAAPAMPGPAAERAPGARHGVAAGASTGDSTGGNTGAITSATTAAAAAGAGVRGDLPGSVGHGEGAG